MRTLFTRRCWLSFGFVVALGSACSNSERSGDGTNGDSADGATAGHGTTAGNSAGAVTPPATPPPDEDGYALWLRYPKVTSETRLAEYRAASAALVVRGRSPTLDAARAELERGLGGLLGSAPRAASALDTDGSIVLGTLEASPELAAQPFADTLLLGGDEAFVVQRFELDGRHFTAVVGNTDRGVLYGSFALLRHLARQAPLAELELDESPRIVRRVLDHWDNLDRSVERGYAGSSLWDWAALPGGDMTRYVDYARANASLGINGSVLTNVNANAQVLTPAYLERVRALADVFRPYGIAVYLTARFSAPIEIGGLATADPLAPEVQSWWSAKADEIYALIPDFGGFVVKANSEGQPGPREYGRTHAEGANLLADALAPHGGIVMWRAFVYSDGVPTDRIRQAYDEFEPLDASFRDNVLVQVKNGPLDFQPREPYHPLFGAMPETPIALELQITKEYLGQDTHLAYLGPLFEEVLDADTFAEGPGSTVARVVDGSLHDHALSAIAGVANIGSDRDWTGQLVRLRAARLGSRSRLRADRRRVGTADVLERARRRRTGDGDADELTRDAGRLHDPARFDAHHGDEPSLRPRPLGERPRARRLEPRLLSPRRRDGHRLRSHRHRQRRARAVFPARARPVCEPRQRARQPALVLPSRRLERGAALGAYALGRARLSLRRRGGRRQPPRRNLGHHPRLDRQASFR